MSKQKQQGYIAFGVVVTIVVVVIIALAAVAINNPKVGISFQNFPTKNSKDNEPKIKHLGVNLDYYNPVTNRAGDFTFTKEQISFNRLFFDYGFAIPASSAAPARKNPQPTFILPLGSKVYSLVDGVVYSVPKLYSGDYSVMVKVEGSDLIFGNEHVVNVRVKKGDRVKAGDVVGEVSGYDADHYAGLGLVEIGILRGGKTPMHLCPFDYLDDSIKEDTIKKITALKRSWEEYRGDDSIYDESKLATEGCLTQDPIAG